MQSVPNVPTVSTLSKCAMSSAALRSVAPDASVPSRTSRFLRVIGNWNTLGGLGKWLGGSVPHAREHGDSLAVRSLEGVANRMPEDADASVAQGDAVQGVKVLRPNEVALLDRIRHSGMARADEVVSMTLEKLQRLAPDDEDARKEIVARVERAYSDATRNQAVLPEGLSRALARQLELSLSAMAWRTLGGVTGGLSEVVHLATALPQALGSGSWTQAACAAAALTASWLPSLRNIESIDQLVQALPEAVRQSLASLQASIVDAEGVLKPTLPIAEAVPALVAALLAWRVADLLHRERAELQVPQSALGKFIAALPDHWRTLVATTHIASALSERPVYEGSGDAAIDGQIDVAKELVECLKAQMVEPTSASLVMATLSQAHLDVLHAAGVSPQQDVMEMPTGNSSRAGDSVGAEEAYDALLQMFNGVQEHLLELERTRHPDQARVDKGREYRRGLRGAARSHRGPLADADNTSHQERIRAPATSEMAGPLPFGRPVAKGQISSQPVISTQEDGSAQGNGASSPAGCLTPSAVMTNVATFLTGCFGAGAVAQEAQEEGVALVPLAEAAEAGLPAQDPLEPVEVVGAGVVAGMRRRGPMLGLVAAIGGLATASYYGARAIYGASNSEVPLTDAALAERLAEEIVTMPDGEWMTGLDALLCSSNAPSLAAAGEAQVVAGGGRRRRETAGVSLALLANMVRHEESELRHLRLGEVALYARSLHFMALAVANEIAKQPAFQWLENGSDNEKVLWVSQHHQLHNARKDLSDISALPAELLGQALQRAGWTQDWKDLTVKVLGASVDGRQIPYELPLLPYCLWRAGKDAGTSVVFQRNGSLLPGTESDVLGRFVASDACRALLTQVNTKIEVQRPAVVQAWVAQLHVDAITAKLKGELGDDQAHIPGAGIVLDFLNGSGGIESAALTFTETLSDAGPVTVQLPNYLALRRTGSSAVVLYHSSLSTFKKFKNDTALYQYLDDRRTEMDLLSARRFAKDVVKAAPHVYKGQFARLFEKRMEKPSDWKLGAHVGMPFTPVEGGQTAVTAWADSLVRAIEVRAADTVTDVLEWSPLGVRARKTTAQFNDALDQIISFHDHAKPEIDRVLSKGKGIPDFDSDQITLTLNGRTMTLADWALDGWSRYGMKGPLLTLPQPMSAPGGIWRKPPPWPSRKDIQAMTFKVFRQDASGARKEDVSASEILGREGNARHICRQLDAWATVSTVGSEYMQYLDGVLSSPTGKRLAADMAEAIRWRTRHLIERSHELGQVDHSTYTELLSAHGRIDDASSSLLTVTLAGKPVDGLWAMRANGRNFIFRFDGPDGDALLDETEFRAWIRDDRDQAENYIKPRAAYRYHPYLAEQFGMASSSKRLRVGVAPTHGPSNAASELIAKRMDNVDEMTHDMSERFIDAMKVLGLVATTAACSVGTGFIATPACVAGTLAMVAIGIQDGVDALDRGNLNDAIESLMGATLDAVDILEVTAMPKLLFQMGRRIVNSAQEAAESIRRVARNAQAFDVHGIANAVFHASPEKLTGAPMLIITGEEGAPLFAQGGKEYVRSASGGFIESQLDEHGIRRLKDPQDPDAAGAPVAYRDGHWEKLDERPVALGLGTTTVTPSWPKELPEAKDLPSPMREDMMSAFGLTESSRITAEVKTEITSLLMTQRIGQIARDPAGIGLPGDEIVAIRAWSDSAKLGGGKSVQTFGFDAEGDLVRGQKIGGSAESGLYIQMDDVRVLPTLEQLVGATGPKRVAHALGVRDGASREELMTAVKEEISRVVAANEDQSLLTWQAWSDLKMQNSVPAERLRTRYPDLTKSEAESLVSRDSRMSMEANRWVFSSDTTRQVTQVLSMRAQRESRQVLLKGGVGDMGTLIELAVHLQALVPERTWRIKGDADADIELLFTVKGGEGRAGRLMVTPEGGIKSVGLGGTSREYESWDQCIHSQLSEREKAKFPDSADLRDALRSRMKRFALRGSECAASGRLQARTLDTVKAVCPNPSRGLTPDRSVTGLVESMSTAHASTRGALLADQAVHNGAMAKLRDEIRILRERSKSKYPNDALSAGERDRLKKYSAMPAPKEDKSLQTANLASYNVKEVSFDGVSIPLDISTSGCAISGNPYDWMTSTRLLEGAPKRRVLVPLLAAMSDEQRITSRAADIEAFRSAHNVLEQMAPVSMSNAPLLLREQDLVLSDSMSKKGKPLSLAATLVDYYSGRLTEKPAKTAFSNVLQTALGDSELRVYPSSLAGPGAFWLVDVQGGDGIASKALVPVQLVETYGRSFTGEFRDIYPFGASHSAVAGKWGKTAVVITPDELIVQASTDGNAALTGRKLSSLSEEEFGSLTDGQLAPVIGDLKVDDELLYENIRGLSEGVYSVSSIRSCSEGKILDAVFGRIKSAQPAVAAALQRAGARLDQLGGSMVILSDMHPCATSCDLRLKELVSLSDNFSIEVFYFFKDNRSREEWLNPSRHPGKEGIPIWRMLGYTVREIEERNRAIDADLPIPYPGNRRWDPNEVSTEGTVGL